MSCAQGRADDFLGLFRDANAGLWLYRNFYIGHRKLVFYTKVGGRTMTSYYRVTFGSSTECFKITHLSKTIVLSLNE